MKKLLLGFLCALILTSSLSSSLYAKEASEPDSYKSSSSNNGYEDRVKAAANELLGKYAVPGVAITVLEGEKIHTYTYGYMNQEKKLPLTKDTIFETASITKLFTALLCADAAVKKEIQLTDPLAKYVPSFAKQDSAVAEISLLQTLTHTAGFPLNLPDEISSREQVMQYLATWQPQTPICSRSQYSNVGIGLAAIAMENKENKSIDSLVKERILKPLGMDLIGMSVGKANQKNYAQGYTADGAPITHFDDQFAPFPGAYSLRASIKDMGKFLRAAVGSKDTPNSIRKAMEITQIARVDIGRMQQGMAWQIHSLQDENLHSEPENLDLNPLPVQCLPAKEQVYRADRLFDKTGGTDGFRSYIAVIPEKKIGVVILLNKHISNGAIVNIGREIITASQSICDQNQKSDDEQKNISLL